MTKKILPLFALITLAACLLSYKLGSAPTAHAQTLPPPPNEWSLQKLNATQNATTVTKPAVSGVQHVADCIIASAVNLTGANIPGPVYVTLYDNTGTLAALYLPQPYVSNGQGLVSLCGLNIPGAVGSPLSLGMGGFFNSTPWTSVTLVGHDAT